MLCEALSEERRKLLHYINLVDGWLCGGESNRLTLKLEQACGDERVERRFGVDVEMLA